VLEPQVVEQTQRLAGEPAELMMMAFVLQLTDHHQRDHHFVFSEAGTGPRIGQQHRGVEHIRPFGVLLNRRGISHERSSN